ncbi:MAG TPA: efflux RND transporter periplasmic adaptor subunit [Casimicrobiaceae bacterium]|nr:efflux RND transporter periplasmic adaptor subunit [Casimicrobiaceae bacterium]
MNSRTTALSLLALALLAAGGYGIYSLGMKRGMAASAVAPVAPVLPAAAPVAEAPESIADGEAATRRHIKQGLKAGDIDPVNGRKILYYHDPMTPGKNFDAPGKSPFMDMMLVPKYGGGDRDQATVNVSPRVQQNLGIRTAAVVSGSLKPSITAVGTIAYNERDQVVVQARAAGYIERLFVRAAFDPVRKGQALAEIFVPEWVAAQEEFLSVRRMQGADLASLVDGARQRMHQVGMSDEQIRGVETAGRIQPRFTLAAPIGGVVVELTAREGMTVMPGATLFRINGIGSVWVNAEVPESQAAMVKPGAPVEARSAGAQGAVMTGRVQAILPEVNPVTRTLKARIELANPQGRLAPGMFVNIRFADSGSRSALLVPSEAVIQTGKRSVVMVDEGNGKFRPVEVTVGLESDGQTEIKRGLALGQMVVVSGQFLIDSEASFSATEARMSDNTPANGEPAHVHPAPPATNAHQGHDAHQGHTMPDPAKAEPSGSAK